MARQLTNEQHEELADRMDEHLRQVEVGLIPADAPVGLVNDQG